MKLAALIEQNADELAALETLNNGASILQIFGTRGVIIELSIGKALMFARYVDVQGAADVIRCDIDWLDRICTVSEF